MQASLSRAALAGPAPAAGAILSDRQLPAAIRCIYCLEPVLAAVGLLVLAPILAIVGLTIRLASGRSPLIAHLRVGQHGGPLWVIKFRTMWGAHKTIADRALLIEKIEESPLQLKPARDPRVTSRFAALCRHYSIDELPQLIHVLIGQMSFIGPRPITRFELQAHYEPGAGEVLSLRPGISGLWQTMGRNRLSYRQRRRLDIFLARHLCLGLYFRVLIRTLTYVVRANDAW